MVESGRMMRSTEECEISRSCHSATFSSAACVLPRTTRARPLICSEVTGLRLCGMAEEPFCFSLKYSSASRTSVRATHHGRPAKFLRAPAQHVAELLQIGQQQR